MQASEQARIALLEQIVNVNSGTMNFAGVRQVGDLLRPQFETLGFKVRWVDGAAVRPRGPSGRRARGSRAGMCC